MVDLVITCTIIHTQAHMTCKPVCVICKHIHISTFEFSEQEVFL